MLFEELEVAPDRGRRDTETLDQRGHVDGAVGREGLQDRRHPFGLPHVEREHTPQMRGSGRGELDRMLVRDLVWP